MNGADGAMIAHESRLSVMASVNIFFRVPANGLLIHTICNAYTRA